MTLAAAVLISAIAGFIALSYEITWFRVYSYLVGGEMRAFGLMLGAYLAGLAVGSLVSGWYCRLRSERGGATQLRALAAFVFLANLSGFFTVPALSVLSAHRDSTWLLPIIGSAGLLGAILPLVSHLGIAPDSRVGVRLSYVYLANIIGSACGSLFTGLVLFDHVSTGGITQMLAFLGLGLTALLLVSARRHERTPIVDWVPVVAAAVFIVVATPRLNDRLYEHLQYKAGFSNQRFIDVVENKHGVVAITDDSITYGGGVYDGRVSTSLRVDRNIIERAFIVPALHPNPRNVLMIGLSTGAWAQVLANAPGIERLTIVEINPGYLSLIEKYPQVRSVLANPRVDIVIDDGRRWLLRHPDRKFDVIIANTTYYWRAHSTNLLSQEYLRLIRQHLEPGGLYHYNTTGSQDAIKTAFTEFPYGMRVVNFATVSDSPLHLDLERWRSVLLSYRIDGQPMLDTTDASDRVRLDSLMAFGRSIGGAPVLSGLESRESVLSRIPLARVVTDDNLLTEVRRLEFPP